MKRIMFDDFYGLTEAVLQGRKTMTRRLIGNRMTDDDIKSYIKGYTELANKCAQYKIGEVVAVAQSYYDVYEELKRTHGSSSSVTREFFHNYVQGGKKPVSNKMFVRADLMPYQIKITDVRVERLQDISDEDCLKEGILCNHLGDYWFKGYTPSEGGHIFKTPVVAFSNLIDKVSGKGTWKSNPWVFAYSFELIK